MSAKLALADRQALLQFLACVLACAIYKCAWLCGLKLSQQYSMQIINLL